MKTYAIALTLLLVGTSALAEGKSNAFCPHSDKSSTILSLPNCQTINSSGQLVVRNECKNQSSKPAASGKVAK